MENIFLFHYFFEHIINSWHCLFPPPLLLFLITVPGILFFIENSIIFTKNVSLLAAKAIQERYLLSP